MQCSIAEGVVRSMKMALVKCFRCGDKEHKCRVCPKKEKRVARPREGKAHQGEKREVRRVEGREVAHPEKGKAQQEEWKRSPWEERRKRAEWYCGPTVPQDAELWELGWRGQGAVVTYLKCLRCGEGGCHVEEDRGQGVVPYWKREKMNWCGCKGKERESGVPTERKGTAREEEAVRPREAKAQQSGTQSGGPESVAREGGSRKEVRRTFKMLREVWLNIGVEKIDTHEGVMIKALLDSCATGMFMDKQMAARHGFKLQKLERL